VILDQLVFVKINLGKCSGGNTISLLSQININYLTSNINSNSNRHYKDKIAQKVPLQSPSDSILMITVHRFPFTLCHQVKLLSGSTVTCVAYLLLTL